MEFRPNYMSAAIESILVGSLVAASVGVVAYFREMPFWFAAPFALVSGVAVFAFYFGRFAYKAPVSVRATNKGLQIVRRSAEVELAWTDARIADHEDVYGLQWRFQLDSKSVVLRDDGFSTGVWDELSRSIVASSRAHDVPVKHDGYAEAFDDRREDESADGPKADND